MQRRILSVPILQENGQYHGIICLVDLKDPVSLLEAQYAAQQSNFLNNKKASWKLGAKEALFSMQNFANQDLGKVMVIFEPSPRVLVAFICPPCASTRLLAIANPKPLPAPVWDRPR